MIDRCSEFIGCLSFGLHKLVTKLCDHGSTAVTNWYHVLPEKLGHRKHIVADITASAHGFKAATTSRQLTRELTYKGAHAGGGARTESERDNRAATDVSTTDGSRDDLNNTNSHNFILKTVSYRCIFGRGHLVDITATSTR